MKVSPRWKVRPHKDSAREPDDESICAASAASRVISGKIVSRGMVFCTYSSLVRFCLKCIFSGFCGRIRLSILGFIGTVLILESSRECLMSHFSNIFFLRGGMRVLLICFYSCRLVGQLFYTAYWWQRLFNDTLYIGNTDN